MEVNREELIEVLKSRVPKSASFDGFVNRLEDIERSLRSLSNDVDNIVHDVTLAIEEINSGDVGAGPCPRKLELIIQDLEFGEPVTPAIAAGLQKSK